MPSFDASRKNEALDWARRLHDPSFSAWDEHIRWLERSPENASALDEVMLAMTSADEALARLPAGRSSANAAANDDATTRRGNGWPAFAMWGGAIAAGLVGTVAVWERVPWSDRSYRIATAATESRSIIMADGSRIALASGTALRLDRSASRSVEVERGRALFEVVHDADRPFTVRAGDAIIQDVGTVFRVARSGSHVDVAVIGGAVVVRRAGSEVRLAAGQMVRSDGSGPLFTTPSERLADVPSRNYLTYTQAPMIVVAQDLTRASGSGFSVDPAIAGRPFTGVILLEGDGPTLARRVEAVTGFSVRPAPEGWRIVSGRQ